MCAIAAIPIAMSALSTVTGMMKQRMENKAQQASAEYNAQVAEENASRERTLAQNEIQKGVADRERQQRNALRQMGEMRSGMGASGFEMNSGTNLSLLEESATEHQYDSNIITKNAEQSAWGHLVSANSAENSASALRSQAQSISKGSPFGIAGTILGGIGSTMQSINSFNKTSTPASNAKNSSSSFTSYPFSDSLYKYGYKK